MFDKGNRLCGYLIEWDRLAKQSKKKNSCSRASFGGGWFNRAEKQLRTET